MSGFEPAYLPNDPAAEAELRRRYSVLFAGESTRRRGGLGSVSLVTNAYGEKLALKELLSQGVPPAGPLRCGRLPRRRAAHLTKGPALANLGA